MKSWFVLKTNVSVVPIPAIRTVMFHVSATMARGPKLVPSYIWAKTFGFEYFQSSAGRKYPGTFARSETHLFPAGRTLEIFKTKRLSSYIARNDYTHSGRAQHTLIIEVTTLSSQVFPLWFYPYVSAYSHVSLVFAPRYLRKVWDTLISCRQNFGNIQNQTSAYPFLLHTLRARAAYADYRGYYPFLSGFPSLILFARSETHLFPAGRTLEIFKTKRLSSYIARNELWAACHSSSSDSIPMFLLLWHAAQSSFRAIYELRRLVLNISKVLPTWEERVVTSIISVCCARPECV
jgi:hypothetical protein